MTQDRRITDKLPGHSLQWDDSASPSAAPAAGQAGLAKLRTYDPDRDCPGVMEERDKYNDGDYYKVEDVQALFATLAAPVAADTEQARDLLPPLGIRNDRDMLNYLMQAFDNEMSVCDRCHHSESTATCDSAGFLREYLAATPLATPADAGAGDALTDERIEELVPWEQGLSDPYDVYFDRVKFARAVEREVLAHLSTPGAPVTACGALVETLTAHLRREMPAGTVICRPDWWAMKIARAISTGSPAPVTAEPAQQWISVDEREPEDNQTVAILYWPYNNRENSQVAGAAEYVDGAFYTHEGDMHHWPSHWAPIPVLPAQPVATDEQGMERAADAAETRDAKGGEHG